jgi:phenylalanyl-tRNA synthetase beta chain
VVVATVGSTLYPNGEELKIKKAKIRGEVSQGMICAEDELGLGESHDGIMVLDNEIPIGTPAREYFQVEKDTVIEIGLTPNRSDAMSHFGVARDLHAFIVARGESSKLIEPELPKIYADNQDVKIEVEVADEERSPRYMGVTLSNLKVDSSPATMANRLKAIGVRPVNNLVDITNYVQHAIGQPLHAFDAERIKGDKIVVRCAAPGEKLVTLDGEERELHGEDLMICDSEKPLCIGGVFGGLDSGVSSSTTKIFLESAYFQPVSIRKTAKRHGLHTDASFRYERGVDPALASDGLKMAASLFVKYANASVSMNVVDCYDTPIEGNDISIDIDRINTLLGTSFSEERIEQILNLLDFEIASKEGSNWVVIAPTYRVDVTREADIAEEILRIHGYNEVELPAKFSFSVEYEKRPTSFEVKDTAARILTGMGYYEMMSNSLTRESYLELDTASGDKAVRMLNPLSRDLSILRTNLLFGALEAIERNVKRQRPNLRLFEFGKVYTQTPEAYFERENLVMVATGDIHGDNWAEQSEEMSFYRLKGHVENILTKMGHQASKLNTELIQDEQFIEAVSYKYGMNELVRVGIVKEKWCSHFDIEQPVFAAVFDWDALRNIYSPQDTRYKEIPKYPSVRRDLALLIDHNVTFGQIRNVAKQAENKILNDIQLFDVYEGDKLPSGKKSYAVAFTLFDPARTLQDKHIDQAMNRIQKALEAELGAQLRQ